MDANQAHLAGRLALVEARVRRLLARKHGAEPLDPLRSLVITRKQVEDMLTETSPAAEEILEADLRAETERLDAEAMSEDGGVDIRLIDLALGFGLSRLDLELLCIALAPDLDGRFGRLFAYLQETSAPAVPEWPWSCSIARRSMSSPAPGSSPAARWSTAACAAFPTTVRRCSSGDSSSRIGWSCTSSATTRSTPP